MAKRVPNTEPVEPAGARPGDDIDSITLRFRDRELEAAYRADYLRHHLMNVRVAHLLGIAMWILWGLALRRHLLFDRDFDVQMRYSVFIPLLALGFAASFLPGYRRFWVAAVAAVLIGSMVAWVFYVEELRTMPPDYGYVGLILISAFGYTLVRLPFLAVLALSTLALASYLPVAILTEQIAGLKTVLAVIYLVSFGLLGTIAAYRTERYTRLLFLRERQLDRERDRSDSLLLNILPKAIVRRLKARREGERALAEHLDSVSVLFADVVGFTAMAERVPPQVLVEALDDLFRRFDAIADRFGLEKIKTVGDAYMAVAGAPVPRDDHAGAAAEMGLAILGEVGELRWPTGEPVRVRIGIASGPAVAGVIGQRKFAYDLWGDTVNLASRLESHGIADRVLVSESTAAELGDGYEFSEPRVVDLKGKGPTRVRFLLGRRSESVHLHTGEAAR